MQSEHLGAHHPHLPIPATAVAGERYPVTGVERPAVRGRTRQPEQQLGADRFSTRYLRGSFEQIFQTPIQCCVKIGHSTVIQATDGNLWVTNPNAQLWGTVYTITPTGTLLQTLAFSGSTNGAAPHFLLQASSGVIYGTTYNRGPGGAGTVFSINAGLPPK